MLIVFVQEKRARIIDHNSYVNQSMGRAPLCMRAMWPPQTARAKTRFEQKLLKRESHQTFAHPLNMEGLLSSILPACINNI